MQHLTLFIFCVFCFCSTFISHGQTIKGTLLSSTDTTAIENAHVVNVTQHKITSSNYLGQFTIEAKPGDTLNISNINFKTRQFTIRDNLPLRLMMDPIHIELKEVQVRNLLEKASDFKDQLINMPIYDPNDSLPFGVTPGKPKGPVPKMYERETKLVFNGGIGLPISFFTKKFSKRHKAERDYYEAKAEMGNTITNSKKYNPDLVTKLTSLEGEGLQDFINYMNLTEDFINRSTEYEIAIKILNEYEAYKEFLKNTKFDRED